MLQLPQNPVVAVVGATGAVGREMIAILESRRFPAAALRLFASPRSRGMRIPFRGSAITIESLDHGAVTEGIDVALFTLVEEHHSLLPRVGPFVGGARLVTSGHQTRVM